MSRKSANIYSKLSRNRERLLEKKAKKRIGTVEVDVNIILDLLQILFFFYPLEVKFNKFLFNVH